MADQKKNNEREKASKTLHSSLAQCFHVYIFTKVLEVLNELRRLCCSRRRFYGGRREKGGKAYFSRALPLRGRRTKKKYHIALRSNSIYLCKVADRNEGALLILSCGPSPAQRLKPLFSPVRRDQFALLNRPTLTRLDDTTVSCRP